MFSNIHKYIKDNTLFNMMADAAFIAFSILICAMAAGAVMAVIALYRAL